jgi:RNA polymerase sigma-70 factor (ECF subfamily)
VLDEANALRPQIKSVACRMLGSVADAEEFLQDAFVRYQTAGGVSSPEGFLVRTTTGACIDRLGERKRRGHVGPWVPERMKVEG